MVLICFGMCWYGLGIVLVWRRILSICLGMFWYSVDTVLLWFCNCFDMVLVCFGMVFGMVVRMVLVWFWRVLVCCGMVLVWC